MLLKVDNVGAERICSGRLFQATGPATQNARLPNCSLVLGTTKSPRTAEREFIRAIYIKVKFRMYTYTSGQYQAELFGKI